MIKNRFVIRMLRRLERASKQEEEATVLSQQEDSEIQSGREGNLQWLPLNFNQVLLFINTERSYLVDALCIIKATLPQRPSDHLVSILHGLLFPAKKVSGYTQSREPEASAVFTSAKRGWLLASASGFISCWENSVWKREKNFTYISAEIEHCEKRLTIWGFLFHSWLLLGEDSGN